MASKLRSNGDAPTDGEIREELERLIADGDFRASERLRAFLRYVTVAALEGRSVKAYNVAVDVFRRPSTFDPADPIVRIEATRLRTAMKQYYRSHGDRTSIRIDIPKGSYAPSFIHVARPQAMEWLPALEATATRWTSRLTGTVRGLTGIRWTAISAAMIAAGFLLILPNMAQPKLSGRPSVNVEVVSSPAFDAESKAFQKHLLLNLSRFQTIDSAVSGDSAADFRGGRQTRLNRYRVKVDYSPADDGGAAEWWLMTLSDEVLQAGRELTKAEQDPNARAAWLADRISSRLAGYRGAIPVIETRMELEHPTLGAGCVQRALVAAIDRLGQSEMEAGRACLEETIRTQPGNADARAVLTYLLVGTRPFATPPAVLQQALELASAAVRLDPDSNRSWAALMVARYHNRQVEQAIEAGRRAIALNPNEAAVKAYLGWILFATGSGEEAIRLTRESMDTDPLSYYDSGATLIMDAFERRAYDEVLPRDARRANRPSYIVLIAQLAALGETGRAGETQPLVDELRLLRPRFEETFDGDMSARSIDPALAGRLKRGLALAGLAMGN